MKEFIINFWPQLTVLTLTLLGLTRDFLNEGKTLKSTSDTIIIFLFQSCYIFLYWKGGFYNEIHAPQVIQIIFTILAFGMIIYGRKVNNKKENVGAHFIYSLIGNGLYLWFLHWGGYFTELLNSI